MGKKNNKHPLFKYVEIIGACSAVIASVAFLYLGANDKIILPNDVQKGSVIPSKLEISVKDLNQNGIDETIIKYDKIPYKFKVDSANKPYLQELK